MVAHVASPITDTDRSTRPVSASAFSTASVSSLVSVNSSVRGLILARGAIILMMRDGGGFFRVEGFFFPRGLDVSSSVARVQ